MSRKKTSRPKKVPPAVFNCPPVSPLRTHIHMHAKIINIGHQDNDLKLHLITHTRHFKGNVNNHADGNRK